MLNVKWSTASAGALLAAFGVIAVHLTVGLGERGLADPGWKVAYNAVIAASALACFLQARERPAERLAWRLLGVGVLCWAIGNTYWTFFLVDLPEPPYPSIADVLWLAFYGPVATAVLLLVRARVTPVRAHFFLDGLIGACAVGAVVTAVVLAHVAESAGGGFGMLVNLMYPVADTVLAAVAVGALIVMRGRSDQTLLLVAAGLLVFGLSDSAYVYQVAAGTYVEGTLVDLGWPAACVLFALAALQPARPAAASSTGWSVLVLPAVFASAALGLLLVDHFHRIHEVSLVLAAGSILALTARMVLTFKDNLAMIAYASHEAATDALTGLGNRRSLNVDLDAAASAGEPHVLALFDLDGFKDYNDSFGHPAGDALLARLSARLRQAVGPSGRAYRMGGDEFCALLEYGDATPKSVVARLAAALREDGEAFNVSASYGTAIVPGERATAVEALRLADKRMYEQKQRRRGNAFDQASSVLASALAAHDPDLGEHVLTVADLAAATAAVLGLPDHDCAEIRMAAALHDIGKVGIPDAILEKPGPLTPEEWRFIHRHPIIGETILAAAPALDRVARIVRASHERWDGTGYPDRLAEEQIPLAARIVFAADAFAAMTSERPYSAAMTTRDALAELKAKAGTQFDPAVVDALCSAVRNQGHELTPRTRSSSHLTSAQEEAAAAADAQTVLTPLPVVEPSAAA